MTATGIDSVEIERMARMLRHTPDPQLGALFSQQELEVAGDGPARAARLAARLAAKEACLKLFPRETAIGRLEASDFNVVNDGYGAPQIACSERAAVVLGLYRIERINLSLTHDRERATAIASAEPQSTQVPLAGRLFYHLLPIRREIILDNMRRVFGARIGAGEIKRLAMAHYGHLARLIGDFVKYLVWPRTSQTARTRVDNIDAVRTAHAQGKGVLILTGHFGSFEVATTAAIRAFPEARGRFYFIRRPFKPEWLDRYIARRFERAGFGTLPKRGSLDWLLERLSAGDLIVFPFDQHASGRDAVRVDFFGHAAGTFRSLALIVQASGSPVVPAASWREPDGTHVLRFENALPYIHRDDFGDEVRSNTRAFNAALEYLVMRHPEQWWWLHRRWKPEK